MGYRTLRYFHLLPVKEALNFLHFIELSQMRYGIFTGVILLKFSRLIMTSNSSVVLGYDIAHGQVLTHVVPANKWFAARSLSSKCDQGYSLVTCNVAPGFDPQDFEMANLSILREAVAKNPIVDELDNALRLCQKRPPRDKKNKLR